MIPLKDKIRPARVPVITIGLVLANVVAYLLASAHGGSLIGGPTSETLVRYGAIPYKFSHLGQHCDFGLSGLGQAVLCTGMHGVRGTVKAQPATWLTAFTAMFLHANILGLLVDMVFLAVFGITLEDSMGRLRFVCFYLLGGLGALGLQIALTPNSVDPVFGASGAIAAVLAGYILLHPRAKILSVTVLIFFFSVVEVPAWAWLAAWLALEGVLGLLGLLTPFGASASAAYDAQLGGFAFGLMSIRAFNAAHGSELPAS